MMTKDGELCYLTKLDNYKENGVMTHWRGCYTRVQGNSVNYHGELSAWQRLELGKFVVSSVMPLDFELLEKTFA